MSAVNMLRSTLQVVKAARGSVRPLSVSAAHRDSFKIQDPKDFDDRVKKSTSPVIVDFYATWCNPCRMLTPRIEAVIAEQKGKVKLAKVDIDQQPDLALDYEVSSVPVLLAFKDGKPDVRLVGLRDTDELRNFVKKIAG